MTEPPDDPVEALFHQAVDLPPGERARLGAVARAAVVARWSWEGIAQRLLDEALA